MSSFHDFGLAEPDTRALADERYVVPTPIQKHRQPIAINDHDVVGIDQPDTVTAAVVALPIRHQLTIHAAHELIDRVPVFIRAMDRAEKHTPSPLKVGSSAEANYSDTSQNQRVLASCSGQVCIRVASNIAVRGMQVVGVNHDVNCDLLDVPESYVPWKGRTTRSRLRRRNFTLPSVPNGVAAGDQEADWDITFATNQRTRRPPQHSRAKAPAIRTTGSGSRALDAASARGAPQVRTDHAVTAIAYTTGDQRAPRGFVDVCMLSGQMTRNRLMKQRQTRTEQWPRKN